MIESGKMGRIYQNAYFVLSADVAPSSDLGFINGDRKIPTREVDLPLDLRHEQPSLMLTVCDQSEGGYPDPVHDLFWSSEWGYNGETERMGITPRSIADGVCGNAILPPE